MFRRIELINEHTRDDVEWTYKQGLMGLSSNEVADAWIFQLRGPTVGIPSNARFYFTEKGWREVGRNVLRQCQKEGQPYHLVVIKETDANIVWRDKHTGFEVAVQPKKKR